MRLAAWRLTRDTASACRIVSRSTHSTFWRSFSDGTHDALGTTAAAKAIALWVIVDLVVNPTALCIVFSSSRTLPGHGYSWSDDRALSSIASMDRPLRA